VEPARPAACWSCSATGPTPALRRQPHQGDRLSLTSSRQLGGQRSTPTSSSPVPACTSTASACWSSNPIPTGPRRGRGRSSTPGILAVEPERIVYAIGDGSVSGYVQGFRDGVDDLAERVLGLGGVISAAGGELTAQETFVDTDTTWGLKAVGVVGTTWTGKGIRIAVLDTGFDAGHPDFVGRTVTRASFITGQTADDGHGHGTHCIGTACGPASPSGCRLRHRLRGRDLRRQVPSTRQRRGRWDPLRDRLGHPQQVHRHLDVARRPSRRQRALSTVYEAVAQRPRRGLADRGRRGQREPPPRPDRSWGTGQLPVDHRWPPRLQAGHRAVLVGRDERERRPGRHRAPGVASSDRPAPACTPP
jgi:hypothetical protein